jgi:enoyl-CoA hydratase
VDLKFLKVEAGSTGLAKVEINRPDALNALNQDVLKELEICFQYLEKQDTRVAILTGAGKAFVAGADIAAMKEYSRDEAYVFSNLGQSIFSLIEESKIVSIAALNGFALGGGLELALACDMRVASNKAKLGLPEVSLGLIPGFGGTQRLARLIGRGFAAEMIFTGDMYSAEDCLKMGLVNKVVEPEALMDVCNDYAGKILTRGKRAVREAKLVIQEGFDGTLNEGFYKEKAAFSNLFEQAESKEGLSAFLEKRKPNF